MDNRGRTLLELQNQSLSELEQVHDYIQWLFPLPERSAFNPAAPILSNDDIRTIQQNPTIRQRLIASLRTMLRFYGLSLIETPAELQITCAPEFASRAEIWLSPGNHNFLRITRILRSLTLLGEAVYAEAFLRCLESVFLRFSGVIGDRTLQFWNNAVRVGKLCFGSDEDPPR